MFVNRRVIRIEWGDCDPAGIVYFPRYVEYFDICTARLFEAALGMNKHQMLEALDMAGFPMVDLSVRFMIPSAFGDDVTVESAVAEFGRSSFKVRHRLLRGEDLAVEAQETRVWTVYDKTKPGKLKSVSVPDEVRAKLS